MLFISTDRFTSFLLTLFIHFQTMQSKKIILFILACFIAGTFLLVYIQYHSSKNIHNLIEGNQTLMNVGEINNKLNQLEKTILKVENEVKGAIVINDPKSILRINQEISDIEMLMKQLQSLANDDSSLLYLNSLDTLLHKKLILTHEILNDLNRIGEGKAVELIGSTKNINLTDSILATILKIDNVRNNNLAYAIESIDTSGKKAQRFSFILIITALICGAALFWYIIDIIGKQILLIRKLNISEKKNAESARIKEMTITNMSHEIRTPMNAILGFARLLQNKNLEKETLEYVQTIEQSAENLLRIINDILDLSKIDVGMLKIERKPFSIRSLMLSIRGMFYNKSKEKNIKLSIEIEDSIPDYLLGDSIRLTQIFINLVDNALKFTEKGTIKIFISNEGIRKELISLGITVSDTGIGIIKEKQEEIFERFKQAEDSTNRNYGGSGLGLSIVRDLVKLQNGTLELESERGKGTTFKLLIPLGISQDELLQREEKLSKHHAFKDPMAIGRILVVEDNFINQSLIVHLFKNWKIDFDLANNGKEALEKLKIEKYSLILMDIQMHVMDGYTATKEIRQTLKIDTPIIAMTAHALAGEKEKCLECGMNNYISKPLREKQLHQLIDQYAVIENADGGNYEMINLQYMYEISSGNKEFEKNVTAQFLEAIPKELKEMEYAWENKDIIRLRKLAHNMKTTISVMSLNDTLQPYLDVLENHEMDETEFERNFREISRICSEALEEATHFYSTF